MIRRPLGPCPASSPHRRALAADFPVLVVSILDGDTIEVLHNTRAERFRLNGIDCPEKGQAFEKRAKQAFATLTPCYPRGHKSNAVVNARRTRALEDRLATEGESYLLVDG